MFDFDPATGEARCKAGLLVALFRAPCTIFYQDPHSHPSARAIRTGLLDVPLGAVLVALPTLDNPVAFLSARMAANAATILRASSSLSRERAWIALNADAARAALLNPSFSMTAQRLMNRTATHAQAMRLQALWGGTAIPLPKVKQPAPSPSLAPAKPMLEWTHQRSLARIACEHASNAVQQAAHDRYRDTAMRAIAAANALAQEHGLPCLSVASTPPHPLNPMQFHPELKVAEHAQ